jgi:uncharacterized protein YqgV (UPF0045/DUF77 family)
MMITVEISMYPFQQDYSKPILGFIEKLNSYAGLRITTGPTATLVIGEYRVVMQTLTEMLEWSFRSYGRAVYVTKFIPDYNPDGS